jgi:uncharacterized protein YaiE (UPF0345 family)
MADKRISQLVDRGTIANNDVVPIVVSGASTTNKATISSIQTFMQGNLDLGVTSVGLSMPSAFVVTNSPVTSSGNISVTGAGTVSQYIRGDGSLADFPQGGGGGSSVNYYLNGSVSQGTIGGIAYQEMNKTPVLGAGTDFVAIADGYLASFITDAGDPGLLEIPGGNWNFETYFSASSGGGTPTFYVELYKVNSGGTATLIASNSATPELIAFGTVINPYFFTLAVPTTALAITDRLALRYYVARSGRTITLHTENSHLCQIITTFTTGLTALNGLTAQVQNFATGTSGTDFAISSSVSTHTFNLPNASATARGVVSTASQTFAGAKTFNSDIIVNGITIGKGGASNGNNTAIGVSALSSNTTGTLNTATGLSALQYNTLGNGNTANGANSLLANTTGAFNTASGNQSLYSNTTGSNNTASGVDALYSNIGGNHNTGIGAGAGYYIADGSTPNTTSDFSIYLGSNSKASVDGAQNEVVIGYNAIGSGSNTVTIGNASTTNNYFTGNIRGGAFIKSGGTSSQFLMADGSVNTSVLASGAYLPLAGGTLTGALNGTSGVFTGSITAGSGIASGVGLNIVNGTNARTIQMGYSTGSGTNYIQVYDGSSFQPLVLNNALTLSSTGAATFSSSVNLGTNANAADTASLNIKQAGTSHTNGIYIERGGERNGYHMYIGGALDSLTFRRNYFGTQSDVMSLTRDGNVGIGTASPFSQGSGATTMELAGNTYGQFFVSANSASIRGVVMARASTLNDVYIASITNSPLVFGTNDTERMRITSGGQLQIKQAANTHATDGLSIFNTLGNPWNFVNGGDNNLYLGYTGTSRGVFATTGVYTPVSDINKKKDFEDSTIGLNAILGLKPTLYRMIDDESEGEKELGFVAQEVKEFIPHAYVESGNEDAKFIGLNYNAIVAALVKAIQEQQEQIDSLKNQIK